MQALPKIMIAPNGARKTKADHPALPVTIRETVETAKACFAAGADGIHAHIRDGDQGHLLDAGVYRELIGELETHVPEMKVQVTTESVGKYSSKEQRDLLYQLKPPAVSIGLKEITDDSDEQANQQLFHWAYEQGISVQHILYAPAEISKLADLCQRNIVPAASLQVLFVLGRYTKGQVSSPRDLDGFVQAVSLLSPAVEWGVCAFGIHETDCLVQAHQSDGKLRVGFENNFLNTDGTTAKDNAERVSKLIEAL